MKRVGGVKRSLLAVLGTVVIGSSVLAGIWFAGNVYLERQREETTKKMREQDAEYIRKMTEQMGKGGVLVYIGFRILPDGSIQTGRTEMRQGPDKTPTVSINWSVPQADFAKIAEGMSPQEVAGILQIAAIHYIPNGPEDRFTLVCQEGNRSVTLVFGGTPDVKLVSKSATP
jgi:hypothetical protein